MNREQLIELLRCNEEIVECLDNRKISEAYQKLAAVSGNIQNVMVTLLQYGVLEEDVVIALISDVVGAMEQKDEVLMADTIKYGINALLWQIIEIMEEE